MCTGALVFSLGLWLGLSADRLAMLVLTVAAVLVLELLNTATEAVVDLAIGRSFHPLAKIAKDCAAARCWWRRWPRCWWRRCCWCRPSCCAWGSEAAAAGRLS